MRNIRIQVHLNNIRKIKKWMEERKTTKPPAISSKDESEKRLGTALDRIRQNVIKPYSMLKTDEEREEYQTEHPEIEEILEIINWIDANKSVYLRNARAIKKWMEKKETTKPPSSSSKDEEEKKLGRALNYIMQNVIKPYNRFTTEEKEKYKEEHPEIEEIFKIVNWIDANKSANLRNARAIKKWMEERETTKPPSRSSKDEDEKKLGIALNHIRQEIIKPYEILTIEEREKYKTEHPEIEEILEIVNWIDANKTKKNEKIEIVNGIDTNKTKENERIKIVDISVYLNNAREIKKWMEERLIAKPPSSSSKDEEEKTLGIALDSIQKLIEQYNGLTIEEREKYKTEYPKLEEIIVIVDWINENKNTHLRNARAIKRWMDKKETTKPPAITSKDESEKKLGIALDHIRQKAIKPYSMLKTGEERDKYKTEHPEIEEILEIINWIDANNNTYLRNARAIKKWMEERKTTKPPSTSSSDIEEITLGNALHSIKHNIVKPYLELTKEEKEKYRVEHPEIEEMLEIINWIDANKNIYLRNARAIKKWMEERKTRKPRKPPSKRSKDESEKRLGTALDRIRQNVIKPYSMLKTDEERDKYKTEHPEIEEILEIINWIDENKTKEKERIETVDISLYLNNARAIKKWMDKKETTKPPSSSSYDDEERRLGNALSTIRQNVIKPYNRFTTEEKEKYKEEHPEIEEIFKIVNWIDANKSIFLRNAREIKKWMEERKTTKPPSSSSYDDEEKSLGGKLYHIRKKLIEPYSMLNTDEEREQYKKKYPELEEVMKIVNWIDANKSKYLRNAREIVKWMETTRATKLPSKSSEGMKEKRLGRALSTIQTTIIKPYLSLETEKEREEFRNKYPETDEILSIMSKIFLYSSSREELVRLMQEDLSKRKQLEEALQLEKEYQKLMSQQIVID